MITASSTDVCASPFPHVISDSIIDPELFSRLRMDYPNSGLFEQTAKATGGEGSRAGKETGFDIYRGDSAYDNLIHQSSAWREFDQWINSKNFIEKYFELFGQYGDEMDISFDIKESTYNPDYIEHRSVLTQGKTVGDKFSGLSHKLTRSLKKGHATELFTRLDITRSLGGYAKPPHCDRPNRLCSLIVYFTDADETGLEGGDLLIYRSLKPVAISKAPRHPRPDEVEVVAQIRPKPNRGVFFPCCNNSYHGVTSIVSQGVQRDFLYINISGRAASLW